MDQSNLINLGLLLVTAIGAAFAGWQALDARAARREAQDARDATKDIERDALKVQVATANAGAAAAAALEEANRIANAAAPKSPWVMTRDGRKIVVRNDSGRQLLDVDARDHSGHGDINALVDLPYATMQPNESLVFGYDKSLASPAVDTLIVTWREAGEADKRKWGFTVY